MKEKNTISFDDLISELVEEKLKIPYQDPEEQKETLKRIEALNILIKSYMKTNDEKVKHINMDINDIKKVLNLHSQAITELTTSVSGEHTYRNKQADNNFHKVEKNKLRVKTSRYETEYEFYEKEFIREDVAEYFDDDHSEVIQEDFKKNKVIYKSIEERKREIERFEKSRLEFQKLIKGSEQTNAILKEVMDTKKVMFDKRKVNKKLAEIENKKMTMNFLFSLCSGMLALIFFVVLKIFNNDYFIWPLFFSVMSLCFFGTMLISSMAKTIMGTSHLSQKYDD